MAVPTVSSIALFAPVVASNAIFSARRASRGVDAMEENPVLGTMNMAIAGAQVLKGGSAVYEIAKVSDAELSGAMKSAADSIKKASDSSKVLKFAGKSIKFIADNINPIICVAGGVKVLGSENKLETGVTEASALGTMFLFENLYKEAMGMPKNGKAVKGAYRNNPFLAKQADALKDLCETKKLFNTVSLKALPGALKGLGFVFASIAGYKLGTAIANRCIGKDDRQCPNC